MDCFYGAFLLSLTAEGHCCYMKKSCAKILKNSPIVFHRYCRLTEYEFGTTWRWGNDERLLLFLVICPFKCSLVWSRASLYMWLATTEFHYCFLKVSSLKLFLLIWQPDLFFYLIYFYFPWILISEICFIFMLITCVQIKILLFIIDISTGHKNNTHTQKPWDVLLIL